MSETQIVAISKTHLPDKEIDESFYVWMLVSLGKSFGKKLEL